MKLIVLALGHKMPGWIAQGTQEYTKRMPRELPILWVELKPEKRNHRTAEHVMAIERDRILEALPTRSTIVALDERGTTWRTAELAQRLQHWQHEGQDVVFIIGGADGLHPEIKQHAHHVLQLSSLTLPHGMVRVVLAEQLYRAYSMTQNHPYHRA